MKKIVALLAGAALMMITTSAMAVPIDGTINFTGSLAYTGGTTPATATGVHFVPGTTGTAQAVTGDYASIPTPPPLANATPVTFQDFTFSPVLLPAPVSPLWTLDYLGNTYDFIMQSATGTAVGNALIINGSGLLQIFSSAGPDLLNFDDTLGSFTLTTQGNGPGNISFSANSTVPEPGTLMLLGAGFLGLAIYGKRRKNA